MTDRLKHINETRKSSIKLLNKKHQQCKYKKVITQSNSKHLINYSYKFISVKLLYFIMTMEGKYITLRVHCTYISNSIQLI